MPEGLKASANPFALTVAVPAPQIFAKNRGRARLCTVTFICGFTANPLPITL